MKNHQNWFQKTHCATVVKITIQNKTDSLCILLLLLKVKISLQKKNTTIQQSLESRSHTKATYLKKKVNRLVFSEFT